jgi:hypothetical protein
MLGTHYIPFVGTRNMGMGTEEGHQYVLGSDVSGVVSEDSSTIVIVDVTTMEQVSGIIKQSATNFICTNLYERIW